MSAEPAAIPFETLRSADEVESLAQAARAEGQVALDTEFLWERTYAPQLCLLQVATRERIALIDPLEGGDVAPIAALVRDPEVELVMHAPSADLLLFALRADAEATRVFDTQLVAGFVGLGLSTSYDRLVEASLSVRLLHDETFSDWKRRPLSETQLAYAADDVRYLLPMADELRRRLERLDRTTWAEGELARRYGTGASVVADPERSYTKVGRRGRLSGRQLAVLREVAAWRETEARRRDLPTGWLVKDPTLVEIARSQPKDVEALKRVRGIGSLGGRETGLLLEAIARGREAEPIAQPREPAQEIARRAAVGSALAAVVLRARCEQARLAPELVATRADLDELARAAALGDGAGHPLAQGWRGELVGRELLELLAGNLGVVAASRPPYVAIVPASGSAAGDG